MGIMDIYEVEHCRRGRWEQQAARFVAAGDADEAAYKVTGEHLHSEGERRKVRLGPQAWEREPTAEAVLRRLTALPPSDVAADTQQVKESPGNCSRGLDRLRNV
jgi:hypothetical protein